MRKLAALFLSVLCAASALCPAAWAASALIQVRTPGAPAAAGEEFAVTVSAAGSPGIGYLQFALVYDADEMECLGMTPGGLLQNAAPAAENLPGRAFFYVLDDDGIDGDGVLYEYRFRAGTDLSEYRFTLSELEMETADGTAVNCTVEGARDAARAPFTDTNGHPAEDAVRAAAEKGYFRGYPDGSFRPDEPLTRAQLATVLWNAAGRPAAPDAAPYDDTDALNADYRGAIRWTRAQGLLSGTTEAHFSPYSPVTRQEAVQALFLYRGGMSGTEVLLRSIYDDWFSDWDQAAGELKPALYWAVYNSILPDAESGALRPGETVSRALMADMCVRCAEAFE